MYDFGLAPGECLADRYDPADEEPNAIAAADANAAQGEEHPWF